MDTDGCGLIVAMACAVAFVLGLIIGGTATNGEATQLRKEAIERGVAEYNSTTGVWQWKPTAKEIDE